MIEGTQVVDTATSEGINPYFQSRREISRSIRLGLSEDFFHKKIERIFFYGAGCTSESKRKMVELSFVAQFKTPVEVESDLLGAARGLFGYKPGIACILGGGSNSCFYNGNNIVKNVFSGGYVLGDEGSGAALGRAFLADVVKNLAPYELAVKFYEQYQTNPSEILDEIYNKPFPNRYLSKCSQFLVGRTDNEYVHKLVTDGFRTFFKRHLSQYEYRENDVKFIGSVAVAFSSLLVEVAHEYGIEVAAIEEPPMLGLIDYHTADINDFLTRL